MSEDQFITAFLVFWAVLGLSTFGFFTFVRNAPLKRRVFPWVIWGSAALFAWFLLQVAPWVPWWFLLAIPVIGWLNLKATHFCDECGRTIISQPFFSRIAFCPKCGAALSREAAESLSQRAGPSARAEP